MNNLIKIEVNENMQQTASARELHRFLEIGTDYRHWFPRMCEYGFVEHHDYTPVIFDHPQNGQPTTDHQMTIEMAKEISMIQRNEKGQQARRYFLKIEKAWNDPELVFARSLQFANMKLQSYSEQVKQLEGKIEADKPKVIFADALEVSTTTILIGELAKLLNQNNVKIGQNRLFEKLREDGYLIRRKGDDWNMPTQKAMDMKLFEIKKRVVANPDGSNRATRTVKVTAKGQIYFINKFLGAGGKVAI